MNYEIIKNSDLLEDFIDWLPDLKEGETYYLSLIARKKYVSNVKEFKSDKQQLKRFTSNKERMFDKIWQLECELGSYKQKDLIVPQESLALYITPNPRSFTKATKKSLIKFAHLIADCAQDYNPYQEVMSEIQKAKSYTKFIDFDFDINEADDMDIREKLINWSKEYTGNYQQIVRTRGGFHMLVDVDKVENEYKKSFYQNIAGLGADIKGDMLLPVIGCTQGDFTPYFLDLPNG